MYHRIHEESETTNSIENNIRTKEDYEMYLLFWPTFIAKFLLRYYVKSQDTNGETMGRSKTVTNTRTRKRTYWWFNLYVVVSAFLLIGLLVGYRHFSLLRDGYIPLNTVLEKQSFKNFCWAV